MHTVAAEHAQERMEATAARGDPLTDIVAGNYEEMNADDVCQDCKDIAL